MKALIVRPSLAISEERQGSCFRSTAVWTPDSSGSGKPKQGLLLLALRSQMNGCKWQPEAMLPGNTAPGPRQSLPLSLTTHRDSAGPCMVSGRTGVQSLPDSKGHSEPQFNSASPTSKTSKSTHSHTCPMQQQS